MEDANNAPILPEEPSADAFFSRAVNVFIAPGRAFESIVRRPDFLAPLIIAIVASMTIIEVMLARIGAAHIVQRSLELSGKAEQMTPERLAEAIHRAAGITAISMRVAGVIGVPIFLLVIAALGLFILDVMFGQSVSFKTAFSVTCYASLVLQAAVVLGITMICLADPDLFNPNNFVPTTVGFFLDPRKISKPLYVIASSFDIFRVWFIGLCSLGLSVATARKVRGLTIFLIFLGAWIAIVAAHAGFVALLG